MARCCQKSNQLQSMQGYGEQSTHKNIDLEVQETEKSVEMATLVARCC